MRFLVGLLAAAGLGCLLAAPHSPARADVITDVSASLAITRPFVVEITGEIVTEAGQVRLLPASPIAGCLGPEYGAVVGIALEGSDSAGFALVGLQVSFDQDRRCWTLVHAAPPRICKQVDAPCAQAWPSVTLKPLYERAYKQLQLVALMEPYVSSSRQCRFQHVRIDPPLCESPRELFDEEAPPSSLLLDGGIFIGGPVWTPGPGLRGARCAQTQLRGGEGPYGIEQPFPNIGKYFCFPAVRAQSIPVPFIVWGRAPVPTGN